MELFAEREVSYTRCSFIILNNLRSLGPEDVAYLASQDCLVIPTGETLDHFLEMYFLHVHPLLPMVNEGNFWKLYCHGPCEDTDKVPLVLFQAILFAASSVGLTYSSSKRKADKNSLYRKKLSNTWDFRTLGQQGQLSTKEQRYAAFCSRSFNSNMLIHFSLALVQLGNRVFTDSAGTNSSSVVLLGSRPLGRARRPVRLY